MICHPPVDTEYFTPGNEPRDDFYLYAGRLVDYKRPIEALFTAGRLRRRLVVAGDGPELNRLRRIAPPGLVDFRTRVSREEMRSLMRRARALLFPGVEDFGIVMVEAQATGTPVIARGRGGAAEIVLHGETGILYGGKGPRDLAGAVQEFERLEQPEWHGARENALRFSRTSFPDRLLSAIAAVLPR
jgi:glycosyltransferase involved in cell wall biosynthesis